MPLYRIMARRNNWCFADIEAPSPEEACRLKGETIGNCFVRVQTPRVLNPKSDSGSSGGGWRNVTTKKLYCRNLVDGNCIVPGYNFHGERKCSSLLNEPCMAQGGQQS